jgi:hypothetical protein
MKIMIELTKKEVKHLASPHTFYDCCIEADDVLRKVQKQIDKRYTSPIHRMSRAQKAFFNRITKNKEKRK